MTPKNRHQKIKIDIRGEEGVYNDPKNRTSFIDVPICKFFLSNMKPFGTKTKLSYLQSPLKVHWRIFLNPFDLTRYFLSFYKVFECVTWEHCIVQCCEKLYVSHKIRLMKADRNNNLRSCACLLICQISMFLYIFNSFCFNLAFLVELQFQFRQKLSIGQYLFSNPFDLMRHFLNFYRGFECECCIYSLSFFTVVMWKKE